MTESADLHKQSVSLKKGSNKILKNLEGAIWPLRGLPLWRRTYQDSGMQNWQRLPILQSTELLIIGFCWSSLYVTQHISWIFKVSRVTLYIAKIKRQRIKEISFTRINFQDNLLSKLPTTEQWYTKFPMHFNFSRSQVLFLKSFSYFLFLFVCCCCCCCCRCCFFLY